MLNSFKPPKRILMGAGPTMVHQRVLKAAAMQTIGHLDPAFIGMMEDVKSLLQYAFQTEENALTIPVSAPGSAGMEACAVNLVEPGDKVIVCINGVFGARMKESIERCGGEVLTAENEWGKPVDLENLEQMLEQNPDTAVVGFVHAETSTGVCSDAKAIASLAHKHGALVICDSVTSLGGVPLLVGEWELDAVYSGSQKCLSCMPGLSPVTFNQRALRKIDNRKSKVQSWFLDLNLVMGYWGADGGRSYHHTAPVNALYSLHESLLMLRQEGIENSWVRHRENHELLVSGLDQLGLSLLVDPTYRLPQLNVVNIPAGVDDAAVRKQLLDRYHLEIGAGLGDMAGKIWRIGLMGESSRKENVTYCLKALQGVLPDNGAIDDQALEITAAA